MKYIKRFIASFLSVAAAFSLVCCSDSNINNNGETSMESTNNTEEMNSYQPIYQDDGSVETAEKWLRSRIENNGLFSFRYDGEVFAILYLRGIKKLMSVRMTTEISFLL